MRGATKPATLALLVWLVSVQGGAASDVNAQGLADEIAVVGPVQNILKVDCERFTQLVIASENNIVYDASTATSMPNRMTERLFTRLKVLAARVEADTGNFAAGTNLRVLVAYIQAPDDASIADTHYEGRAADLTVTNTPSGFQLTALAQHAAVAGIEWVAEKAATNSQVAHLHVSVIADRCYAPIDLVFLLDGSGSIDKKRYGGAPGNFAVRMLGFVKEMVDFFTIGENDTHVGVVTFADSVTQNFKLNS